MLISTTELKLDESLLSCLRLPARGTCLSVPELAASSDSSAVSDRLGLLLDSREVILRAAAGQYESVGALESSLSGERWPGRAGGSVEAAEVVTSPREVVSSSAVSWSVRDGGERGVTVEVMVAEPNDSDTGVRSEIENRWI